MNTFHKQERLCLQKEINFLFKDGNVFLAYPFKIIWKRKNQKSEYPFSLIISVSKRYFKRAVDRNRIKRLTREAWRKNKLKQTAFHIHDKFHLNIALLYIGKEIPTQAQIETKINLILQRLLKENENPLERTP